MRTIYLLFAVLFFYLTGNAQSPDWLWAKSVGGNNWDNGYCITSDVLGNVYATGLFQSPTVTFGTFTLVSSSGDQDVFIVKYDSSGNVIWAKSAGGSGSDEGTSITTDASGNIYLAGYFGSNTINFGSITLIRNGSYDIFLAKYDSSGNVMWAKSIGGNGDDEWPKITTDAVGNLYMTGWFRSSSITIGNTTLVSAGGLWDFFIAKYDSSGNVIWAKSAGGSDYDYVNGISIDADNNVYLTGAFASPILSFGSISLLYTGITPASEFFIAKYNSTGNVLWAKSAGGTSYDEGNSITTDTQSNAYVTGTFLSPTITFGNTTLINNGSCDIFITKYDPFGEIIWAKSTGGNSCDRGISIINDALNNIYLTGYFSSPTLTFGNTILTCNDVGLNDIFIAKYNTLGNPLWAKSIGGNDIDWGESITIDATGNLFLAGGFLSSTINFGSTSLANAGGIMSGGSNYPDIFIAKLSSSSLGINEPLENENSMLIYPNPASNKITLHFNAQYPENAVVKISDMTGKMVFSHPYHIENDKLEMDITGLTSGIYLLNIQSPEFSHTEKLIVTK